MVQKSQYQKSFFMLTQEDKGFSRGVQAPSGYIKIETTGSKGRLSGNIQNLRPAGQNVCYRAYMIKQTENYMHPIHIGKISLKSDGSAELNQEFDPSNFYSTGRPASEFNVFAIVAEHNQDDSKSITLPLVGFLGDRIETAEWKALLKNVILAAKNPESSPEVKQMKPQSCDIPPEDMAGDLKEIFGKYFERCNPFNTDRKDYMCGLAESPVHLNNTLSGIGIKIPDILSQKVIMAHFKYRHLIVGTYSRNLEHTDYIVWGVPGMRSVDEKPFEEGRWVLAERNGVKYGSFGYWLLYIDANTKKPLGSQ